MAIEIQPEKAQGHGGGEPGAPRPARPWWLRPAIHTAVAAAVIGYLVGHWLGNFLGSNYQQLPLSDSSDFPIVLGYLLAVVGWLAGLGVFNDPLRQMAGRPVGSGGDIEATSGLARYFRYSLCSRWRSGPSCCRRSITSSAPAPTSSWWASTAL
jgi:hypothetical protein